jgi:hypothetical protein
MPTTLDRKLAVVRPEDFQGRGDIIRTIGSHAAGWPLAGLLDRPVLEVLESVRGASGERDSAGQQDRQFCALSFWVSHGSGMLCRG